MVNQPHIPGSLVPAQNSLVSRSFQGLLWTNWLTVINDNTFRWLVIGIGKDYFPPQDQGWLLMIGSVLFVLPYLLFASIADWLADRFSKRDIVIACKVLEIAVMALGITAIVAQNFNLLLLCVFLMGTQSALFAPSKIGAIPELLDETKISAANGYFNLAALSGVIIGMALGGWLKDVTGEFGVEGVWLSGATLIGIATAGSLLSLFITRLPVANDQAKFPILLVGETCKDLYRLWQNGALFRVALGISFFWAVGSLGQLNIDQFAFESGAMYESDRTPLLISLILGVGLGSVVAGWVSANRIELGLVPWGALGIVLFAIAIYFVPDGFITYPLTINVHYVLACALLAFLGISAGMFDLPLESYMQHRSPVASRGSILSAVNFMLFSGILLTSVLFFAMRAPTYPAELANLPAEHRGVELPADQREQLERLRDNFEERLADADHSLIDEILQAVDELREEKESLRRAALTQLLWLDMRAARQRGEDFTRQGYYQHFPLGAEERVAVKHAYEQSSDQPLLTTRQVFLVLGLLTLPVFAYAAYRLPQHMARILMYWILRLLYRVRVTGYENLPARGGAVLVGNHITWIDGAVWLILIPRRLRMIAWVGNFKNKLLYGMAQFSRTILIGGGPKSIHRGLTEAQRALANSELVGLFPEGMISKTGQIHAFKPGMMKILEKMPVPVIPVYQDETWGSIFSHAEGKAIWKLPKSFRRPLTFNIGKPITQPQTVYEVRQAVMELSADAVANRQGPLVPPVSQFLKRCKQRRFKLKIADSAGTEMTGGSLLMRTVILRRLLRKWILDDDESHVGVLIPPTAGAFVVNLALALDRRVAVNLNYTVSSEIMNECIQQAGIRHVLTSRKVMEKFDFDLQCEVVYLEDLRDRLTLLDKLAGITAAHLIPASLLHRIYRLHKLKPDDVLTVIFTSGSTGVPKGVMLTQKNIATNVDAMAQVVQLRSDDMLIGILPFFHSFGYMATLWGAAGLNIGAAYHFSPLEPIQVGKLAEKYRATLLLATPTFLRGFLRRCTPQQFATLDVVVAGAEKLPVELCDSFENKFGVRPVEGYGTTELSPLVSVNVPPSRSQEKHGVDCKEGTVGRPVPNVAAKVIDVDSGEELGPKQPGMLWIKGPNVMKGYLNLPDRTEEVIQDGWYKTGDIAVIDDDGFIQITGRLSRFSKIGGEMVPHVKIEEELGKLVAEIEAGDGADTAEQPSEQPSEQQSAEVAVSSVHDEKKGERLVVLHTKMKATPAQLRSGLAKRGLPNLFIPSENSFFEVESIPLLGTGKLDLKALKELAEEKAGGKQGGQSK